MARPEADPVLSPDDAATLLRLGLTAIRYRLGGDPTAGERTPAVPPGSALANPGATFVTIEAGGRLRGCVGTLQPHRRLCDDVVRNAVQALHDPRLAPVAPAEWPDLVVTVSVLTRPEPLLVTHRAALEAILRPDIDGLILTLGTRRATFLPVVWQRLTQPRDFVTALLAKGGWTEGWPVGLRAWRYTAVEFTDRPPRPPLPGADPAGGTGAG